MNSTYVETKKGGGVTSTIITYTKKMFSPADPHASDIEIHDIAHALSLLCRANGHFPYFYSIAQHSVNCSREALAWGLPREVCLACLLHDASEAYMSDLTRPVKQHFPEYLRLEEQLQTVIYERFGLSLSQADHEAIGRIDDAMLYWEFFCVADVSLGKQAAQLLGEPNFTLRGFGEVEEEFLALFEELH